MIYRGYTIRFPASGGKAGKGLNRTSSVQVLDADNCIKKQFRYTAGVTRSSIEAERKAQRYIDGLFKEPHQ